MLPSVARSLHSSSRMSGSSAAAALYAMTTSTTLGAVPENVKDLTHHAKEGKGYRNPWDSYRDFTASGILKALMMRRLSGKQRAPDTTPPTVPVRKPSFLQSRVTPQLRATWLGHACYYVEFPGGFRVLFDPVFTDRCSPFSFMGPKRYTEPPCEVENLPYVDAVVISHNHYDHLSHPTIMKIQKKYPNVHFFAPLGNKAWFDGCGIHNMTEVDWWESRSVVLEKSGPEVKDTAAVSGDPETITATIGCLPCQHTSARTPFDKSHTLWASWSIESGGKKLWFGGDTGYRSVPEIEENEDKNADYGADFAHLPICPAFKQIGDLRGPFDLGLIPIGAYDPRYIMSPMHANPYDSVNIFLDTKCKRAMGIHWGTWVLTEEDVLEPPQILKKALAWKSLPETGVFDVCDIGESREFEADVESKL
ncbi:hypothetical protein FH972_021968 [Carpinus fangiana]|uniref:Metallo-beta-lactamase domain-containing protein n=1 Tax=Carpinus fangiana TaxID=176857 RepID=A0A5N6KQV7_9ROSI|nr:hypothetical protein FH972_021968 [Carpinus fangiana]